MSDLDYRIDARDPARRELTVELTFAPGAVAGQGVADHVDLFLPTWTPGSYLVREYSRQLGRVMAASAADGAALPCSKVAKNRFRVQLGRAGGQIRLRWTVYAHELSVRTADLTAAHAYWNHACLLLWPVGGEALRAQVSVRFPAGWELACALPLTGEGVVDEATSRRATFAPRGLDEVMDAPCLVGRFRRFDWLVRGVPHGVVLDGLAGVEPPPTLQADLQAIVERAAAVFGGELPYARYLFLCLFAADGHGGLEHADSTTLLMARTALCSEKGYREFLALAAHELFHAWNVKRLRPAEFWHYDYERENYTEFLWLVEGWTAYYDDLLCLRAGLFTRSQYLEAAAKNVNAMLGAPGRLRLSLRESSFDAWIRLYRPDEHTRNSSQNYYTNGAVAAMCLDLFVRRETRGARSLDDVLHGLYASTFRAGRGYTLDDVQRVLREVAGDGAVAWLGSLVDDRLEPPLEGLLAAFAVKVVAKDAARPLLGVQFETGSLLVASVTAGTPADEAGLHPGDEILAVAGLRADSGRWADVWSAVAKVGQPVELLLARRGVIERAVVTPRPSPGTVALEVDPAAPEGARGLLGGWLPESSTSPAAKAP